MPLFDQDDNPLPHSIRLNPVFKEPEAPSTLEAIAADFRVNNPLSALPGVADQLFRVAPEFDTSAVPDFNAFEEIKDTEYEQYAGSFFNARNPVDVDTIKEKIDQELEDRETLSATTGFQDWGILFPISIISDPTNLLPGGSIYKSVKAGRAAVASALSVGVASGSAVALQEGILQLDQLARTDEETTYNVLAGVLLGAGLGGAASFIGSRGVKNRSAQFSDMYRSAQKEIEALGTKITIGDEVTVSGTPGDAGAAAAARMNAIDSQLADALGLEKGMAFQSPLMRLAASGDGTAAQAVLDLAETPFLYKGNKRGIATTQGGAVETIGKLAEADAINAGIAADDFFVQYRLGREKGFGDVARIRAGDIASTPDVMLDYNQFDAEVARAMRRGDRHEIPEVAKAAAHYRKTVIDPLAKRAVDAGLLDQEVLDKEPLGAASYFMRVYDNSKIIANRTLPDGTGFEDKIAEWYNRNAVRHEGDHAKASEEASKLRQEVDQLKEQQRLQNARRSDETLRRVLAAVRGRDAKQGLAKHPALGVLRGLGGVRVGSLLAQELNILGVTPKKFPGLFVRKGGVSDFDNIPAQEHPMFRTFDEDYIAQQTLLDAVADELNGKPWRIDGEVDEIEGYVRSLDEHFNAAGVDVNKVSDDDLLDMLDGAFEHADLHEVPLDEGAQKLRALRIADLEGAAQGSSRITSETTDKAQKRLDAAEAKEEMLRRLAAGSDIDEARSLAKDTVDKILGAHHTRLPYDIVSGPKGPLRERVLSIPDNEIEDYLVSSASQVSRLYARTMSVDTAMVEKFGSTTLEDQIEKIRDNFLRERLQAKSRVAVDLIDEGKLTAGGAKKKLEEFGPKILSERIATGQEPEISEALKKHQGRIDKVNKDLNARERDTIRDLEAIRDRVRGTYGMYQDPHGWMARTERSVLALNYVRLLGGMTLSALPDMAMPVFRYGFGKLFKGALTPLFTNFHGYRAHKKEMRALGIGLEMAHDARLSTIADVMDNYGTNTKFERGIDGLARGFGIASLMSPWNATMKQFAGTVAARWTVDEIGKMRAGKIQDKARVRLAAMSIDAPMAERIGKMLDAHASDFDTENLLRIDGWTDKGARDALRAALVREVDRTILTPGQDKPLWMSRPGWKTFGQFKSFAAIATQRILISGLQERELHHLNGAAMMLALGALVYQVKSSVAGKETPDPAKEPEKWMTEALDRSGMLGWMMEANNIADKFGVGAASLITGKEVSRYESRNTLGALAGPSAGLLEDLAVSGSAHTRDGFKESDARALRRLAPFQNLFYMRWLFDEAEKGAIQALH